MALRAGTVLANKFIPEFGISFGNEAIDIRNLADNTGNGKNFAQHATSFGLPANSISGLVIDANGTSSTIPNANYNYTLNVPTLDIYHPAPLNTIVLRNGNTANIPANVVIDLAKIRYILNLLSF
jgi:hypothetical protein